MSLVDQLRQAARGDARARDVFLQALEPEVRRRVHGLLQRDYRGRNPWILPLFSTGDIVQEMLIGLVVELGEAEGLPEDEAALGAFLAARIRNRILDRMRFHGRQKRDARREARMDEASRPFDAPGRDPSPSTCAGLEERFGLLAEVLGSLGDKERELWRLRFDEEAEFGGIAEALGYKNAESARAAFRALRARLAMRLRRLGLAPEAFVEEEGS